MPVYKGDKYLPESVESILNQTFYDFEFIIICDDPTEMTRLILDNYQQDDSRIKIYYQERQGLVNSLNRGISFSQGEYVARMDADDISLPNRVEKQVKFMDDNPEIGISGTAVESFGDGHHVFKYPCDHNTMISQMLFTCPLCHPSVIIRKSIFCQKNLSYDQNESYAEDLGLWIRAAKVLKLANIPDVLLNYRVHASITNKSIQEGKSARMRLSQIKQLDISPTESETEIHEALGASRFESSEDFIYRAKSWLEKLQYANLRMKIYPEDAFSNVLGNYWYYVCLNSKFWGVSSLNMFHNCELSKSANILYIQKAMLVMKPAIKPALKLKRALKSTNKKI